MSEAGLPDRARVVIIGGGVGGAAVAYHLTRLGCRRPAAGTLRADQRLDLPLRRPGGTAARQPDPDADDGRQRRYLPRPRGRDRRRPRLARGRLAAAGLLAGTDGGAAPAGGLGQGVRAGHGAHRSVRGAGPIPLMSTDGVLGAAWLPTDGYLDPTGLTMALAAGARQGGARITAHTRVTGIEVVVGQVTSRRNRPRPGGSGDGGERRRHVRARDRAHGRRQRARHPVRAPVPGDRGGRRRPARPAAAARPGQPRLLPRRRCAAW